NQAPTAADDTLTTAEDTTLVLTLADFGFADTDAGQVLSAVVITSLPLNGQLLLDGVAVTADQTIDQARIFEGKLSFVPAANAYGDAYASFDFKVVDSGGLSASASNTLTVNVTAVNDAPVFAQTSVSLDVDENTTTSTVIHTAQASDVEDGTTLSYSLSGDDAIYFDIDEITGDLRFKLAPNYEAGKTSYAVQVVATDSGQPTGTQILTATQNLTITLKDVNEAPTAISLSASTLAENNTAGAEVATLTATDPDGALSGNAGTFTYALVSGTGDTDNSAFTILGDQLKLTGVANYEGQSSYSVRIQVTDAGGLTYETTKTITVSDVNEAPTAITLQDAVALQENVSDRVVVATLSISDPDTTEAFTTQTLTLEGTDADSFSIEDGDLVFNAGQTVDYETKSSYSVTVVANAGTAQEYSQTFTVNVDNSLDTLTLASNSLLLTDHDSTGLAVNSVLSGTVSGALADRTLTYNLSDSAAFLNRSNVQQLFDGNPATGTSPTLQFALQDTSAVTEGMHSLHLQLGMSNARFAGLNVSIGLDVQVQLSRDAQGHLTMVLPTQTADLTLSAGGQVFATVPMANLDPNLLSLGTGLNGTPSLSLQLDSLIDKAADNVLPLASLQNNGLTLLAGGAVMGLLGGQSLGDLAVLARQTLTLPPELQDMPLTRLMQLVQDTVTLPAELQQLPFDQVLALASQVLSLPAGLTLGTVMGALQDAFTLPVAMQGTLGTLRQTLVDSAGLQAIDELETLARQLLGSGDQAWSGDLSGKTISDIMGMLANSNLALQDLSTLASNPLAGYDVVTLLKDAARVIDAIYGNKSLAQVLSAAQSAITLSPQLAALQNASLAELLNLSALAVGATQLLGADNLSVLGLLNLVRDSVTVNGVISGDGMARVLQIMDSAFDLSSLLGPNYSVSQLVSDLQNGQIALQPLLNLASQAFFSASGQITAQLDLPAALGLTDANGQLIHHIVVNAPVRSIDTLTLQSNTISVFDVDALGHTTVLSLAGQLQGSVMSFDLAASQSGLNRSNLLQLLDGNPATGVSPTLQFALMDTQNVHTASSTLGVGLDMSNSRMAGLSMGLNFDVQMQLVRDAQGQLQMLLPSQTVQMHLSAAGMPVLTLPVGNLASDAFTLVNGSNGMPSLALKIDRLIDKAADNTIDLSTLGDTGTLALAAGTLMGLLDGRSLGDLLSLSRDVITLPPELQNVSLTRLMHIVQDAVTLPVALQNLSFDQVMQVAADVVHLPLNVNLGELLVSLRQAITLPDSLQAITMGDLRTTLGNTLDAQTLQAFENLARHLLAQGSVDYTGDLASMHISDLLNLLQTSDLATQGLPDLFTASTSYLDTLSAADFVRDAAHVVDALFGSVTLAQVLDAAQQSLVLTPELASASLSGVLDLAALGMDLSGLLGADKLNMAGLLGLVREAVTVDGVIQGQSLAEVLQVLDGAFDLSPLLGSTYTLTDMYADLANNQVALQPLLSLAGRALLGADGQANVTIDGLADLGLTSADGTPLSQIVVHLTLDDTPNTAGAFGELGVGGVLANDSNHFDLGAALALAAFADPQGDSLAGVFIEAPWAGTLNLNGQTLDNSTHFVQAQDLQAQHLFVDAPLAAGQSLELTLWTLDSRGALGQQQHLYLQVVI
ncbi:cadherin domain-containing protein, partial [Limnohabitans sp.]